MVKKKKRNSFNLFKEYRLSWNYIKESKKFIYVVFGIFVLFSLIGFFLKDFINSFIFSLYGMSLNEQILGFIEKLLLQTQGMNFFELTKFIFLNNLQGSFMGLVFGIALGIFPVLAIISNGYLLGFVAGLTVEKAGLFVLWRILPHGIFELPAIFISLGLGLRLGTFLFLEKKSSFKECVLNSLRVFFLIIFPLLIIAGIIEGALIFFFG